MFSGWFSTKEVDQFANELASEFNRRFPVADMANDTPQAESRLRGAKDLMMSRTQIFVERHKLNILKRAKLANTLKWKLSEFGYNAELTDALVYEVVRIVTLVRS